MSSKTSEHSRLFNNVVCVVVGFIICAILSYYWHVFNEFHKGKLRADYPLLVYKCEYIEEYESKKGGIFGLVKYLPQWVYLLTFANLSRSSVKNIDISADFEMQCKGIHIKPIACQFFAEPKTILSDDSFTLVGTNINCITLLGKELTSGKSASLIIIISSEQRPSLSDFKINLNCSNGSFEKITSTRWEQIGWQKVAK